jgi:D-alanyl-D-alanine carboxypeptidase/D-alanyl-D-alanine-endopeptidase (penicillin-binding protein 4)
MKKNLFVAICCLLAAGLFAQDVKDKLQKAYQQFESDPQLKYAISSLYVINAKTGKVVFDKNSQIGLAPASTQKIITASTAFELLGKDFRYETEFGLYLENAKPYDTAKPAMLYIKPSGDPTFGSWRWENHNEKSIMGRLMDSIRKSGMKFKFNGYIIPYEAWNTETIPDGWIWQDVGNYYGAGAGGINWRENQFDVIMKSGNKIGDPVTIENTKPNKLAGYQLMTYLTSAAKGSGDNAYIYFNPVNGSGTIRGTIPVNEDHFIISGAVPSGYNEFIGILNDSLHMNYDDGIYFSSTLDRNRFKVPPRFLYSEFSPSLDSIIYWFLKKSINLYGEALTKTFAYKINGIGSTDTGVSIIKNFWKQKGIDPNELNIKDGSGLSPQNRVTTHAQVEILKYAKQQSWFSYFYNALPEYNGMKMKSGSINDVKGFCGYQTSKKGDEYIFSFLVNNYNGASSSLVQKMYKVLDMLKQE